MQLKYSGKKNAGITCMMTVNICSAYTIFLTFEKMSLAFVAV